MNILEIKNLSLELDGHKILNNLTFDLWQGYVHAIIGPNGSGKSTLANTIMGLTGYKDFSGDIIFGGESIKNKSVDERARLGITLAWQEPARFEGLKVKQFLQAAAKDNDLQAIKNTLDLVGIDPEKYMDRAVDKTLSGGERKKIELASLLLMKPRLALLDEPDSGIDIDSIRRIFEAIELLKNQGTTVVLITHSMDVLTKAEHGFLLCHGNLIDKGEVPKISKYFGENCKICKVQEPEKKAEV
jgi:Fe-S cluster assembly ATP-binding protein